MSSNQLPDEMTPADVEQKLNQWKTNIDAIKRSYFAEAVHIGDVESRLDEAQQKLYRWIASVKLVQEKQKLLDKELDFVSRQQDELTEDVAKLSLPEQTRESTIATTVDDLSEKLASLNVEILKRSGEDVTDPKITIAKILNAQLSALDILTSRIVQLRKDVSGVTHEDYDELFEN